MKNKEYFSHDYYARNDPKLCNLRQKYGMEGLGIYWSIIEILHEQNGKIRKSDICGIAFELRVTEEFLINILVDCMVIKSNKQFYYSERVNRNITERQMKSEIAKENGRLGGIARAAKNNIATAKQPLENNIAIANQLPSVSLAIKGKEIKGKEIKQEEIEKKEKKGKEVPQESEKTLRGEYKNIPLSEEQYQRLVDKYGQFAVDKKIGSMSSAKEATPKKYIYKNYEAALRNWIESDSTLTKQSDKTAKVDKGFQERTYSKSTMDGLVDSLDDLRVER